MIRRGVESSLGRAEIQMALQKIISGGQTGVDRGALAAAFPCGGGCPADRQAEDGSIPTQFPVTPLPRGWLSRTDVEERVGQRCDTDSLQG
jgi:hypothetical protein